MFVYLVAAVTRYPRNLEDALERLKSSGIPSTSLLNPLRSPSALAMNSLAWATPFSTCRLQGGALDPSLLSCHAAMPQGFHRGGGDKELALFCSFSVSVHGRSSTGQHREAPETEEAGSPQLTDKQAVQETARRWAPFLTVGLLQLCWATSGLRFAGSSALGCHSPPSWEDPLLPTATVQLLHILSPPVHFLPQVPGMFLDCTHGSLAHLLRPSAGSSFTQKWSPASYMGRPRLRWCGSVPSSPAPLPITPYSVELLTVLYTGLFHLSLLDSWSVLFMPSTVFPIPCCLFISPIPLGFIWTLSP